MAASFPARTISFITAIQATLVRSLANNRNYREPPPRPPPPPPAFLKSDYENLNHQFSAASFILSTSSPSPTHATTTTTWSSTSTFTTSIHATPSITARATAITAATGDNNSLTTVNVFNSAHGQLINKNSVQNSFNNYNFMTTDMWDPVPHMDPTSASTATTTASSDCDCAGAPPPEFMLPPPPRPPFLQNDFYCSEDPLPDIETCDALPMIDASYHSSPSLQTYSVIILCSVILCLVIFISIILVWKHKRKVQNFLPCKTSPTNHCTGSDSQGGAGVIYEDLNDVIPRPTPTHHATIPNTHHHHHHHHLTPSIEMIDVKNSIHYPSGYPMTPHSPPVFLCSSPGPDPYCSQDLYNPVYEELSDAESDIIPAPHSEDEFAEDELSLGDGERGLRLMAELHCPPPPYSRTGSNHQIRRDGRSLPPGYRRQQQPLPPVPNAIPLQNNSCRRPRSLDRRRNAPTDWRHQERGEFHEGMLLDALLQLYPRVGSVGPAAQRLRNGGVLATERENILNQQNNHHRLPYLISNNTSNIIDTGNISPNQSSTAPYDSVSVIGGHHLGPQHNFNNTTFRPPPKPHSQDSALGSDSGYSNHTAGTRNSASSGSNRGRRDPRRLSQLSADLAIT